MKRTYIIMLVLCTALGIGAQNVEEVEIKDISDPEFEWEQFDSKQALCKFKKGALLLEVKKDKQFAVTTTELPFFIGEDTDFTLSFTMEPDDLDDDHPFGIVFDYKNLKNFQVLKFGKKKFTLTSVEGGESAIVKQSLYKVSDKKKVMVTMERKNRKLSFYIGPTYLPLTTLRRYNFQYPNVGFFAENKTKVLLTGFGYRLNQANEVDEVE